MYRPNTGPTAAYFEAIKSLHLRHLVLVLKAGYDPNLLVNKRGQNGLQFMISYFNSTEARFRLQAAVNKAAYLSIAKLLLDSGLDGNTVDLLSGESALFEAIRVNDKDMVLLLLNHADFSIRNRDGETALMCAARFGSKQVMRLILDHLRSLNLDDYFLRQRNRFGLSALDLARSENLECAKVLTKHLITFGRHASALNPVITRSSSHHNLLAHSLVHGPLARAAPSAWLEPSARVARPTLMDDLLLTGSDYDSDLNAADWQPVARRSKSTAKLMLATAAAAAARNGRLPIDSRAAEFNQYLQATSRSKHASGQLDSAQTSDEDATGLPYCGDYDYDAYAQEAGDYGQASGPAGGGLRRSKSCVLGPNSGSSKAERGQLGGKTGQQAGQQVQASQQAAKYAQGGQK